MRGINNDMNFTRQNIKKAQQNQGNYGTKIWHLFRNTFFVSVMGVIISVGFVGVFFVVGVLNGIFQSSPSISTLDVVPVGYATVIYDGEGKEITKLVAEDSNRSYVSKEQISDALKNAFVAIEDERFYQHNGIDLQGIGRAFVIGTQNHFDFSQGASTITQQLLKNNVFTDWVHEASTTDKFKRKLQEQYLAIQLEKKMDKDKILELYLNTINLGQNTLGVQAASMRYFNKPASEINLSEAAVIAGITQNPSKYNPISHPDDNAIRREKVLDNMLKDGYITQSQHDEALHDDVYSRIQQTNVVKGKTEIYSYFVDALTEQIVKDIQTEKGLTKEQAISMLYSGGLSVYSTQDPKIQGICNDIYQDEANYPAYTQWLLDYQLSIKNENDEIINYSSEMLKSFIQQSNRNYNLLYANKENAYEDIERYKESILIQSDEIVAENIFLAPQPQVSLTVEEQETGFVVAMIGGRGEKVASRTLNRATNTKRQPGSCFKVVSTYAPAIDIGEYSLASQQLDAPFNYYNGRPVANWWGGEYRGWLNLRYGIKMSCNVVTVKTLTDITPQVGFDYLQDFGFTTLVDSRDTGNGGILSDIGQPLALGGITDGVTNMELNAAYATIANYGKYLEPKLYSYILDHDGNIYMDCRNRQGAQVLHDSTAYIIVDAMKGVVNGGTGSVVNFGNMAIAGKTGTTSDNKDVWFAGSTPYYTATTWTGYDNNVQLNGAGVALSKSLWKKVMQKIHEDLPYKDWEQPQSVVRANVCPTCGKLKNGSGVTELVDLSVIHTCNGIHKAGEYVAEEENQIISDGEPREVCAYTGQTPCPECPYKIVTTGAVASGTCPHNAEFMADPNADSILEAQLQQMKAQDAAAQENALQALKEENSPNEAETQQIPSGTDNTSIPVTEIPGTPPLAPSVSSSQSTSITNNGLTGNMMDLLNNNQTTVQNIQ